MNCILLISFLLLNCLSCSTNTAKNDDRAAISSKDSLVIIKADDPEITDTIRISQFADSLFYILLERTPQCKISGIRQVSITDSLIFVLDVDNVVYAFNKNGKFIRTIARDCWGFDVLEESKLIFTAKKKIDVYNYSGERVCPSIRLEPEWEGFGSYFAAIDSNTIAISIWNQGIEDNRLVIIHADGSIVGTFPNREKFHALKPSLFSMTARYFHRTVSRYHNNIFYHPYYSDTLFSLSKNKLEPVFIERKIFKTPLENRMEYLGDEKEFFNYFLENEAYTTRIFYSMRYYFVVYNLGRITETLPNYLLYDKVSKQTYNYKQRLRLDTGSLHFGFYNDYDGGLPFNPAYLSNELLIEAHHPLRFKDFYLNGRNLQSCNVNGVCVIVHHEVKSGQCNHPERKMTLERFINQINEDSNPVLIVARLKGLN